METLQRSGLVGALNAARERGTPILGICVGAQLMLQGSDEGPVEGLDWIGGRTRLLQPGDPALKVPHIGWNEVHVLQPHPLLADIAQGDSAYFVHAYYLDPSDNSARFAESDYGGPFCCAIGRDNMFATQFHPEKSGRVGLSVLKRFASWDGSPC
jgi:glutamine amidotransferase